MAEFEPGDILSIDGVPGRRWTVVTVATRGYRYEIGDVLWLDEGHPSLLGKVQVKVIGRAMNNDRGLDDPLYTVKVGGREQKEHAWEWELRPCSAVERLGALVEGRTST